MIRWPRLTTGRMSSGRHRGSRVRPAAEALLAERLEDRRLLSGVPTWVRRGGGIGNDIGTAVSALADGSAITAGAFTGSATFGGTVLAATGSSDSFVAKLTASGTYAWAIRAGGTDVVTVTGVAAMADGTAIVTGRFSGKATFGGTTLTSAGSFDVFVAKTTAAGAFAWAVAAGGSGNDGGNSVTVLADGASLIAGEFTGNAAVGGTSLAGAGAKTPFVAKVSPTGKFAWASCPTGAFEGKALSISSFADGSAIVGGCFVGTVGFGAKQLVSAGQGDADAFVAKIDAGGAFVWANRGGGATYDVGSAVACLPDGSSMLAGAFQGTATFGAFTLTSVGTLDVFVAKVNANGKFDWATQAGGSSLDEVFGITVLPDGSSCIAGVFGDVALFGGTPLSSEGGTDAFVAKLTPAGSFAWASRAGGPLSDMAYGLSTLADGSTIVAGAFAGTAKFGGRTRTSAGESDVFTARLSPLGLFTKPQIDLDGNGVTDTIWVSDTRVTAGWVHDSTGVVLQSRNLSDALHLDLVATGDFDGDGVTDFVWRDPSSGKTFLALMRSWGATRSLTPLGGDLNLRIEASGDYDGDGHHDLIWRNALTGVDSMWLMNGASVLSSKAIGGSPSLRLVATAPDYDSNGDGRTDLVWRDVAGMSTLWRMNGTAVLSTKSIGGDLSWQIVGTGDFNGDGRHDLLWRHANGTVSMWLMNDGVSLGATVIETIPQFVPIGTIDLNDDGRTDIVWYNGQGMTAVKLMDGPAVTSIRGLGFDFHWSWLRRPGRSAV